MKIGIVLSGTPAYSETFFRNKIRFLKEAGYDVTLYIDQQSGKFDLCEVKTGFTSGKGIVKDSLSFLTALIRMLLSPLKSIRLFKLNRRDHFSFSRNIRSLLLCAHILNAKVDWLHFGFATIALGRENLARSIGAKMAVTVRGYDIIMYPIKHKGCYLQLWKKLDKLHYISDDLLQLAQKNGFDAIQKPSVKITPAINLQQFSTKGKKGHAKLTITTIARLHWIKGLEYTLEALAMLKRAGIDFEYHIIGEGIEKERLILAAHQFDITDNVIFCGRLDHNQIAEKLNRTDIYIQYSINEGFCNSVLEAQAMGCICIVSDVGGLRENIIHNQTGLRVKSRCPELLYTAIHHVISLSENERAAITNTAMNRVKEEFNLEKQKRSFIEFYAT